MSNYQLITKGLKEIVGDDVLQKICEKRSIKIYWGTAPTGRIHIGYFIPMLKIAELVQANCNITILIADLHAMLDNLKSTEKQVKHRSEYYIQIIKYMLIQLNVDLTKITFVLGSSFQLSPKYTMDIYRMNSICKLNDVQHAGAEVVKQSNNPPMTGLLYPTLQALDEEYLQVDAQLGGIDQRKIFMLAREFLPKIGYKKRIHLMTSMVSGLRCVQKTTDNDVINKMSASDEKTKLDLLDSVKQIRTKINSAYCLPGDTTDNSILEILQNVVFPLLNHVDKQFIITRKDEYGGNITYAAYNDVCNDFVNEKLHPNDLKEGVVQSLNIFIEPIRDSFNTKEWKKIINEAYS